LRPRLAAGLPFRGQRQFISNPLPAHDEEEQGPRRRMPRPASRLYQVLLRGLRQGGAHGGSFGDSPARTAASVCRKLHTNFRGFTFQNCKRIGHFASTIGALPKSLVGQFLHEFGRMAPHHQTPRSPPPPRHFRLARHGTLAQCGLYLRGYTTCYAQRYICIRHR
jgi:hypothetical protein